MMNLNPFYLINVSLISSILFSTLYSLFSLFSIKLIIISLIVLACTIIAIIITIIVLMPGGIDKILGRSAQASAIGAGLGTLYMAFNSGRNNDDDVLLFRYLKKILFYNNLNK